MPKLLVFCIDALCASDIAYMRTLPHFGWILQEGALVEKINPVFPALTYCCHTSILTGNYVSRHGIFHNEMLERGGKTGRPWFSMKRDVQSKTLLDVAREHGLTTCSLAWPVSGAAEYDLNMPMIVPYKYTGYEPEKWLIGNATQSLMDRYFYKHGRFQKGPDRSLDLFTMAMALDILQDYDQPDVMLVKMCDLDSVRHRDGVYHENTKHQLRKHDEELGALMEGIRRKGTFAETNFVVLGDHGQTDIRDVLLMNVLLKKHGFLETDAEGNVTSFDAFCHGAELTAVIELRDPEDMELAQRVRSFLESLQDDPEIQLSLVLDAKEAAEQYGYAGPFEFVIESKLPIAFGEDAKGDKIWASQREDLSFAAATHGGSPERAEVTTFFACGPAVRKTTVPEAKPMVDIAPTLAHMLGFEMRDVDGKPMREILR